MVLTPTKKTILCNNSTTSGVDDINTIETQKNEVYGLNLALPNDSATSSHDHQQRGQAYEEVWLACSKSTYVDTLHTVDTSMQEKKNIKIIVRMYVLKL